MRIGVDVMGGDRGPEAVVSGAVDALRILDEDDQIVLVGDKPTIEPLLENCEEFKDRIAIHHTEEAIGMGESPVEALRKKPGSSIAVLGGLQRDGHLDACVSAGNTGACVAAAHMMLGTLKGVQRPGIAIAVPYHNVAISICDVGANIKCRPQHLYQYAVMTSLYVRSRLNIENPRIALLSVGKEEAKGTDLVKAARKLIQEDDSLNFIGNVESRDLLRGVCDVIICEGFVGNVVLKLIEGVGEDMVDYLKEQVATVMPDKVESFNETVKGISMIYDFNQYGGAPLLGINGIWIICHGASSTRGIMNAVMASKDMSAQAINRLITERLSKKK
jgi:glycerol-3-phosphate acyltransferase PlsX